ncbi:MAG: hypothetical protein ABSG16_12035 [Candidatus Acidiferrum sp.]|jgi:hypothetical protein
MSELRTNCLISRFSQRQFLQDHPNPLTTCGSKVFSQNDEDGITLELLRRIGLSDGVFAELGVGNGLENNTLVLAAAGWSGFWVGGEDLSFDFNPHKTLQLNFTYQKQWIKLSNIVELCKESLKTIRRSACDLISLDLDGNDYYLVEELLTSGFLPKVFIVEYNAKFPPPIKFKIAYDDNHRWAEDDYFGASIAEFYQLFQAHDYFLACCNITGVNAFFIRNEFKSVFPDIPSSLEAIYASPKYYLYGLDVSGHKTSMKTIAKIFSSLNPAP